MASDSNDAAGETNNTKSPLEKVEIARFHRLQEDLENAIGKDSEADTAPQQDDALEQPDTSLRGRVDAIIHSQKFQIGVIVLVIIDCVIVVSELLVEQKVFGEKAKHHVASKVLHYISISILAIFLVEILFRLFVLRLNFFKHKFELFDAVVVIVSFVLDIVYRDAEGASSGFGLIILLRMWRVLRIVNGINLSIKIQAEKKLAAERHQWEVCRKELAATTLRCQELEREVAALQDTLQKHGIEYTSVAVPAASDSSAPSVAQDV